MIKKTRGDSPVQVEMHIESTSGTYKFLPDPSPSPSLCGSFSLKPYRISVEEMSQTLLRT